MDDGGRFNGGNGGGSAGAVVPPHNLEAEQSVLGAVLLSDTVLPGLIVDHHLSPEDFYRESHARIYRAMLELHQEGDPVDALTLTEHLKQAGELEGLGGAAAIHVLAASVPAVSNLAHYARIVRDNAMVRRLLRATWGIQQSVHSHEAPPRELIDLAEKAILEVASDDRRKDFRAIDELLHTELDKLEELSRAGRALTGTPSGFADVDDITGGFQSGNLIVLAARPSMGKCLAGSSLVYDPRSGGRRRIDEVVEALERGETVDVAALGADLRLRAERVSAGMRSGVQALYRVTTRLGRQVVATESHPLLTIEGWRELGSLRQGDRIAVPRRLPRTSADSSLPDHEVGTARISAGRGGGPNPVTAMCKRQGLWGRSSASKVVPAAIFAAPDAQIARFLAVLYACDGRVYASGRLRQIGYTTISERRARDVQHLLLRLGIVGKIRRLRRAAYDGTDTVAREVLITGQESLATFADTIPVVGKTDRLQRVAAEIPALKRRSNVDTLPPEIWSQVLVAKSNRSWSEISRATGRPPTHNWHVNARGIGRGLMAELAVATGSRALDALATSDVWWDEIASVEYVGEEQTFDLTVPDAHNFVADDVVVHNSALMANFAENAALQHGKPVAMFSLEMSESELAQRFIASQASIKGDDLRKGRVPQSRWQKILAASSKLAHAPLYVDDSSDLSVLDVRAKARRLAQQHPDGLGLILIDYLQLMRAVGVGDNRVEQIGQISRGLKTLARELEVPVIALSQLNRSVEQRHDKRPILSDLRESGCLSGETRVYLPDAGEYRRIDQLAGRNDFRVAAINTETWKLEPCRVTRAFCTGRKPVLRLRTRLGRELRATANHRFLTIGGWRRLDELACGQLIALPRRLGGPLAATLGEHELALMGHLIGDGCTLPRHAIQYTTKEPELARIVADLVTAVFGDAVRPVIREERTWIQVYLAAAERLTHGRRNPIAAWLDEHGVFGLRSHEKRVPSAVFAQPAAGVARFLRHLWATDGCLWHQGGRPAIYYATSSERLARDVQSLLLRLDVTARMARVQGKRGRPQFHVIVSGAPDARRFLEVVGATGERRAATRDALLRHYVGVDGVTNRDVIPREARTSLVKPAMEAAGVTTRALHDAIDTAYCGSTLYKSNLGRDRAARVAEAVRSEELRRLAMSDVYWDRIDAIEPDGETDVFDLTVDRLHNFVAEDVIVHNSIEQDADLVMFIYRDEYYDQESEREGIADLIIAKHRNGGLGTVQLTFQKEYPRFMSYFGDDQYGSAS